jgi:hypothetical protein
MDNFSDDELRELVSLRKELVAAGPIVEAAGYTVDDDTPTDDRGQTQTS